jgi:uncharacterized membrane protein YgdD (TMEM256/DUF423 family)
MIGLYVVLAGVNGIVMLVMGSIGAHGLEPVDPSHLASYQIGWQMHGIHSVFLLAVGLHGRHNRWLHSSFWLGLSGTMMFCVPLYGPALNWWPSGSFLTPVGGFFLMAAWFGLVLAGLHRIRVQRHQVSDPDVMRRYYEAMLTSRQWEK